MISERKSPHTVRQYIFFARKFEEICGKNLGRIEKSDIDRFKEFLAMEKKYSKSTQYSFIKAIQLYFRSAGITPPRNLTAPKRGRKVPVFLTDTETKRMIEIASRRNRENAIIQMFVYTGIRISELCSLNVEDVDLEERVVLVRSGKGDKDRMVIMSSSCADAVRRYISTRPDAKDGTHALFLSRNGRRLEPTSVQRMVKRIATDAGIEKHVTPHVLRHTFATRILRNGGDIRFIQKLLGHASLSTTEIYTHIDDRMLKEMYSKFMPDY